MNSAGCTFKTEGSEFSEMPTEHTHANWPAQKLTWPVDTLRFVNPKQLWKFQSYIYLW